MTDLVIRRLLIDLETPLARHWNGGDAFRTAFFNALSMSFPLGEQFFIDSVKRGLQGLSPELRERHEAEARGFIGQEATHRRIHQLFNQHLQQQGLVNHWEGRIRHRLKRLEGMEPRVWLGLTAATEHFTAIMAEHLLSFDAPLAGTEERLQLLWRWHASEESEHRCTAFDLYYALGGDVRWRRRLFYFVTWHFTTDLLRQTVNNLWHDRSLWRWSTWSSGARFLFGQGGMVRELFVPWRRYLRTDFHPSQQDDELAHEWLAQHANWAVPVNLPQHREAA